MRLFGSERMMNVYKALGIPEGEEIHHKTITKQIEKAQKKIENNNFGIRKNLLDYDQVNNDQREVIYAERRRVLDGESMQDVIYRMIKDTVKDDVEMIGGETSPEEWNMVELNETLRREIPLKPIVLTDEEKASKDKDAIIERLQDEAMEIYHAKEKEFEDFAKSQAELSEEAMSEDDAAMAYKEGIREVERVILLKVIDSKWMNHIDDMDQLRQSIGLQAYGQKDPVVQYKFLGYDMFEEMTKNIRHDTVSALMHVRISRRWRENRLPRQQEPIRTIPWRRARTREKKPRLAETTRVLAAAVRNINSAAEDSRNKKKPGEKGVVVLCGIPLLNTWRHHKRDRRGEDVSLVELDQFKFKLNQYKEPMEELGMSLELERKKARMEELEAKMEEPDFWSAPEKAQEITKS